MTRSWYIATALDSFKRLNEVLGKLTPEEIIACLELEASTQRRRSVLTRLISRAVRLNEIAFSNSLQEKFHAPSKSPQIRHPRREENSPG